MAGVMESAPRFTNSTISAMRRTVAKSSQKANGRKVSLFSSHFFDLEIIKLNRRSGKWTAENRGPASLWRFLFLGADHPVRRFRAAFGPNSSFDFPRSLSDAPQLQAKARPLA